ncbi:helix-turn-helix domain-containing protein [Streptomyces marincola]|uniref:helix-turn-helix domain-containing protein n=1 Tax=Streptomyces marincola TaxID=2878388 RepID=UPI0021006269|nr:helix-turn-helix transcriptional regulator [Streptomyces marincola]
MNKGELGAALRALREISGQPGKAVARSSVMSVSKLSKIETGKLTPSIADVERILTAIGVSEEVKAEYLELAREELTEVTAWRIIQRMGLHKAQEQTRALEAQMTVLRLFQSALIPGLLQTPEYVRAVLGRHGLTEEVFNRTTQTRLARQAILYEGDKELHFVITETVLRWRIVSPARMVEQLDRLISLSRLTNVHISVIPFEAAQDDIASHAFVIRDDRTVTVETVHAEIVVTDPRDVALYVAKFYRFERNSLQGDKMRAMLEKLRDELLREQGSG